MQRYLVLGVILYLISLCSSRNVNSIHLAKIIEVLVNGEERIFSQINQALLYITSNKVKVEDYRELFSQIHYKRSLQILSEAYKTECPAFYQDLSHMQSDKDIGKSLYSTLLLFLEVYSLLEDKPGLELNCFSGVTDKSMVEYTKLDGTLVPSEEVQAIMRENIADDQPEENKKNLFSNMRAGRDIIENDDYMNVNYNLKAIDNIIIAAGDPPENKPIRISNEEYVKRYMRNSHKGYMPNDPKVVVDYSISQYFFPDIEIHQGQRGICYTVASTMLFSMHINRLFYYLNRSGVIENGKNPRLEYPFNYVQVELCSSSEEPISKEENKDFIKMEYYFENYNIYNKGEGGYPAFSVIWMYYHFLDLMTSNKTLKENSNDIMQFVPRNAYNEKQTWKYSNLCKNYQKERAQLKIGFSQE